MTYKLFGRLLSEAKGAGYDAFIFGRGWEEWMNDYSNSSDASAIADILNRVYSIAQMSVEELVDAFSSATADALSSSVVPKRTLQGWKYGERTPAPYMIVMMSYVVFNDYEKA